MIDYLIINELQNHANIIPVIGRGQNLDLDEYVKIKAEIIKQKFCTLDNHLKFLIGGKYGECPPYFINYSTCPDTNFFEITNHDNSDFVRLYYLIVSYIPFDCIIRTKHFFYQKYKKTLSNLLNDNKKFEWNYNNYMV